MTFHDEHFAEHSRTLGEHEARLDNVEKRVEQVDMKANQITGIDVRLGNVEKWVSNLDNKLEDALKEINKTVQNVASLAQTIKAQTKFGWIVLAAALAAAGTVIFK